MANSWIIAVDNRVANLVATAREVGGRTIVVTVGDVVVAADRVINVPKPEGVPPEAVAPAVAKAVQAEEGDVVLAADRPAERVLAGAVAATLRAPLLIGVKQLDAGRAELARHGGISKETVSFSSPVVALLDGGEAVTADASETETAIDDAYNATIFSTEAAGSAAVDLSAAKRIVAAGRAFKSQEDLKLAEELATQLGAELACSRPLAEGSGWLARDRYIGVSGQHVAPQLYVAVGISGQIQHTAGMTDSKVVVAINNDENAPILGDSDYGIVGDLYTVLPALVDELK